MMEITAHFHLSIGINAMQNCIHPFMMFEHFKICKMIIPLIEYSYLPAPSFICHDSSSTQRILPSAF